MNMESLSDNRVSELVKRVFGPEAMWDRKGRYCFVHMDEIGEEARRERVDGFVSTLFFDPACPCCQPFLTDGAFMVYDGHCVTGARMLSNGTFETVMLASDVAEAMQ